MWEKWNILRIFCRRRGRNNLKEMWSLSAGQSWMETKWHRNGSIALLFALCLYVQLLCSYVWLLMGIDSLVGAVAYLNMQQCTCFSAREVGEWTAVCVLSVDYIRKSFVACINNTTEEHDRKLFVCSTNSYREVMNHHPDLLFAPKYLASDLVFCPGLSVSAGSYCTFSKGLHVLTATWSWRHY